MSVLLLILGLFLFVMLVVVHEFGHFIVSRRNGVEVEEFGIGFPPKAWGKKMKGGFLFTLNWLPLGGFVKLKGEHDADTTPGSYGVASLWTKVKIMLAGVGMNLLTAFVLFTIIAAVGMPKLIDNQFTLKSDTKVTQNQVMVAYIEPNSPAANATIELPNGGNTTKGLQEKDKLLFIRSFSCGTDPSAQEYVANPSKFPDAEGCFFSVKTADGLPHITKSLANDAGDPVTITVERGGKFLSLRAMLRKPSEVEASQKTANPKGYLGISPAEFTVRRSTWSAPIVALGTMVQLTSLTFQGLAHAIHGLGSIIAGTVTNNHVARQAGQSQASQDVSGPLGIFYILKQSSQLGIVFVLFIIAYISLALAIMNVLPIPALDGGRLFLTLGFHAARKPLKKKTEELINGVGFVVLITLVIIITVVDFKRFH